MTALTEAARARTPLVVLVGDTPPDDRRNPQDIDQAAVVAPTGAGFQPVRSAACAPEDVALAVRRARLERRPVVLNVPTPLLDQPAPDGDVDPGVIGPQAVAPDPAAVARAAELLVASRRPLIVAGRGAAGDGARRAAQELAERAGALVGTTLLAKGLFGGDPFAVGVCGGYTETRAARDLIAGADCVVAVGAGLSPFTTDGGRLLGDGVPIVHIDSDPSAFGRWTAPAVPIHADAETALRALAEALPPRDRTRPRNGRVHDDFGGENADPPSPIESGTWRTKATAARLRDARESEHGEAAARAGLKGIDLHGLVRVLDELVPAERTVVVDGGHAALSEPSTKLRVPDPQGFVFPLHFGSIGLSLASAVGAAFARPDRLTLCVVGDGGFLMSLSELDTAVRHQLELVVVVMNDGGYGWEYHQMRDQGLDPALSQIPRPDFAAVARGLGADGVVADMLDDVRALRDQIHDLRRPLLIDAHLDPDVRTEWYAEHASSHSE